MKRLIGLVVVLSLRASIAGAYVDITPSLGSVIKDADSITVLRVEKVSREKQIVVYKKVADLKGELPDETLRHRIADGFHPREPRIVMEWAEPGQTAICFTTGNAAIVCIGQYWYQCAALEDHWWTMTTGRPELSLAFFGRPERLRTHVAGILAGGEETITVVSHGVHQGFCQYANVAFQKVLRGKDCPVWRIKASLQMPERVWQVNDHGSLWVVGPGAACKEDVPRLVEALAENDPRLRAQAADELSWVGAAAQDALAHLNRAFADDDPLVRISAARAVALISEEHAAPIAVLQKLLRHDDAAVRKAAASAIGDLGRDGKGAVAALREAMSDKEAAVRWTVAEALGRIGADAAEAIPALAEALRDPEIRPIAADSLGAMGIASRGAVPLLLDGLKDQDADFRWTSAIALTRIDAKAARAALPIFIEHLSSTDHRTRWDTMMYIKPMGLEAKDAAPAVRKIVIERRNGVAAETLAAIAGPDAIDALPVLLTVLEDDWDTTGSIAKIGPAAIPAVLEYIEDESSASRVLAIKALELLAPQCKEASSAIRKLAGHPNPSVRQAAEESMSRIADE